MKLQYLGDARDAFKWDLLHWICTRSSPPFAELVFVPLLTPDDGSSEGRTPHHWFKCQDFIRPFVASLQKEPRSLAHIDILGSVQPNRKFHVSVFAPATYVGSGRQRAEYWSGFEPEKLDNSVVFFDPDDGFETKTQHGMKWIRHAELKDLVSRLPQTSVAVVYQHRPQRRTWVDLFADLSEKLSYIHTAVAAHESNLAFISMADNSSAAQRVTSAIQSYANEHAVVRLARLRNGCA
jgi:hypothetical protein